MPVENPAKDLLLYQARVTAALICLKIMVIGFLCINWNWQVALFSTVVWVFAEKWLARGLYNDWHEEIMEHLKNCPGNGECSHDEEDPSG